MKISEFCIKRPVFATVINLLIVLAGVMSYSSLTVREFPKVDKPVVSVSTRFSGASAEIIENQVTRIIEDSLTGLEGVDYMASDSKDEKSEVSIVFLPTQDLESATNDVRDRVARAKRFLPQDVEDPLVIKADSDSNAIMWLAVSSKTLSMMELSSLVQNTIKDKIEMVSGVANLHVVGERIPSMRVMLDSHKLKSQNLSIQDVANALRTQNVELPSGRVESDFIEFSIFTKTDLKTVAEFEDVIVIEDHDHLVRLKDIAKVEVAPVSTRFHARYNGQTSIALGVVKQSTANPLDISNGVKKVLPKLDASLGDSADILLAYDSTAVIKKSIHSVYKTLVEALVLVILVIFLFLRSLRATLIPIVTIPISLIGVLSLMAALGFSINTLTLLAMVLAIGLVVDDAIVVLENIYRHVEEGMKPMDAAFKGMNEIGFAVISMTLTLLAVFTPVAFSEGEVGKLFTEFAIVLAGAVFISGFVALTLTPMMCSKLLRAEHSTNTLFVKIEQGLNGLANAYTKALNVCLTRKYWVLGGFAAIMVLNAITFTSLKSELVPPEDRGFVITIGLAPEGSGVAYTDKYAKQVEQILSANENVRGFFTIVGYPFVTQTMSFALLPPHKERDVTQNEVVDQLNKKLWGIPGIMSFAVPPPASIGSGSLEGAVEFIIMSPEGYEHLAQIDQALMAKVRENPNLLNVQTDLEMNKPQIELTVDRDRAGTLGVSIDDIGHTLETLYSGSKVSTYKSGAKLYDVILQSEGQYRANPSSIEQVFVKNHKGEMIQLSSLVYPKETVAPKSLNHFNKMPSLTVTASLGPDYSLDEALDYLEASVKEISSNVFYDYGGASRDFKRSSSALAVTFLLALLVIFLVLAAQFESFKHPLVIMLSVPCAIFGALLTLKLTGGSLNVFSQIGFITLIGLITKHGILIVEFANQQLDKTRFEAVKTACLLRFRPILMTTFATVLGAMPLALATGAGAEGRTQIGLSIVGGMTIGTVFTLFVVPAIYLLATDFGVKGKVRQGDKDPQSA